ncbi:hypothetical protein GYU96_07925 [Lactobacillus mellis]|nr:hypothetical protein [Bombilactobacillus mellis]NUG67781.1 hypothetical protein [Bombilactobacillus mellis]
MTEKRAQVNIRLTPDELQKLQQSDATTINHVTEQRASLVQSSDNQI